MLPNDHDEYTPRTPVLSPQERAWTRYCRDTAGSMHVADFWHEVTPDLKDRYLRLAQQESGAAHPTGANVHPGDQVSENEDEGSHPAP